MQGRKDSNTRMIEAVGTAHEHLQCKTEFWAPKPKLATYYYIDHQLNDVARGRQHDAAKKHALEVGGSREMTSDLEFL